MQSVHIGSDDVWRFVLDRLKRRIGIALLVVTDSRGHAPGKIGFKIAVGADGALAGTIGGGRIEHDTVEEARALLRRECRRPVVKTKVHHPDHPQTSGMVCGGRQSVLTYPCRASDLPAVKALLRGRQGVLRIGPAGMSFAARARGGRAFYTETLRPPDTLYIVGSGHVGLALSRVMSMLDFRIVVFDQRPDVDTLTRNVFAHEKRVLSFDRVGRHVRSGDRSYVAIMTHSHRSDEAVLRQLFGKRLRYVGLMASPRKAELVFDRLRSEGVPERLLRNVRSPIGLPIASHTPAEIAISIAAEIIQTRNAGHR